ncbi:MAG: MBL fold metallo-hydrolase, partial [Gemmatimonadetes bacterium]|nr:MBL fold metallo-hydrolase [Gemmatimonadota bacterium]
MLLRSWMIEMGWVCVSWRRNLACLVMALAAGAPPLGAQMAGLRTERLADSVYAIVRTTRPRDPSDANTLVIINDRDVVVVDGNITPQSTREVIREIRKLTANPVRYVIITHFHSDHHTGNIEYRRAWPDVEFVAHVNTYQDILDDDVVSFRRNVSKDYPDEIARLRGMLARGTRSDGAALSAAEREQAQSTIDAMAYFIAEASSFEPIPPTLTFGDSLVLRRGTRPIVVRYLGYGNTRGDVVVHLPKEGVLATGDLVVAPVPFAFGSFPLAWTTTLERLRALPATVIMPGHGEPMRDWA